MENASDQIKYERDMLLMITLDSHEFGEGAFERAVEKVKEARMNKPLTKPELAALSSLIEATGLTYTALAKQLDVDPLTLSRWVNGERPPNHPAMLKRALQLIVLEQRGVLTERLIEQA